MAQAKTDRADRVRETLDAVISMFDGGDVPAVIEKAVYPAPNVPMAKWSLSNRVIAMMRGTEDARGYRQWQAAGRQVVRGARAFSILGPRIVKEKNKTTGEERSKLIGFVAINVFKAEDTEGDPLEYQDHLLPSHPLLDVAAKWNVKVKTVGFQGSAYGWTNGKELVLCTPDELTFFHEMGHVADGREHTLRGGQHSDQEIVAQLVAAVLSRLVGRKDANDGYTLRYIESYARAWFPKLDPKDATRKACQRVLSRACKAIESILSAANSDEDSKTPAETVAA